MKNVLVCVKAPDAAARISKCASRMGVAQAVRTVMTMEDLQSRLAAQPFDALLVEVSMARPDPVQFTRSVLARSPHTGVVLVGTVDPRLSAAVAAAGARGIIRGGAEGDELVVALSQAIMLVCPDRPIDMPRQRVAPRGLTEREMQVLRGMSQGKSNAEIGRDLFVSEDTVKTHARRLFRKLGARDRAHAVAEAFRGGLVH